MSFVWEVYTHTHTHTHWACGECVPCNLSIVDDVTANTRVIQVDLTFNFSVLMCLNVRIRLHGCCDISLSKIH